MKPHRERILPLGYILIDKDTKPPQTVEEIKLLPFDQGPINTRVMRPFRIWKSPVTVSVGVEREKAALWAYQKLLLAAVQSIAKAKGSFVLYVEQRSLHLDYVLVGGIYKYA